MENQLVKSKPRGYSPRASCSVYAYEAAANWIRDLLSDGGGNVGTYRTRKGRVTVEGVSPYTVTHRETADSVYVTATAPGVRITTATAKGDSSIIAPPLDSGGARGMKPGGMNSTNTYQAYSDSTF